MFSNVSEKIKRVSVSIGISLVTISLIGAVAMLVEIILDKDSETELFAILLAMFLLLAFVSLVWAWLMYGYGILIEKVCSIEKNVKISTLLKVDPKKPEAKQEKIKFLFDEGLISVDEYLTDDTK